MTIQQAYEDGMRAFYFRIEQQDNPHKAGTEHHFAWQAGWLEVKLGTERSRENHR